MLNLSRLTKEDFEKLEASNIIEETKPLYDRLQPYLDMRLNHILSYKSLAIPESDALSLLNKEIDIIYKEIDNKINKVINQ